MKLYSALIKKDSAGKIEDIALPKEGFSFYAFIFSGLWFLYHKMWREALLVALLNCVFIFLGKFLSNFDYVSLEIIFAFMIAINANAWLFEHLKKKNYTFVGVIFGNNLAGARVNFLKNYGDNREAFADKILT